MARTYLSADARCKQLQRLVERNPGQTTGVLAQLADLAYESAKAYLRRLVREQRVEASLEDPSMPRSQRRFYPLGWMESQRKAA
jgi:hypothetical protein